MITAVTFCQCNYWLDGEADSWCFPLCHSCRILSHVSSLIISLLNYMPSWGGITDIVHFDHHLDLQIWTYCILDTQCVSYLLLDEKLHPKLACSNPPYLQLSSWFLRVRNSRAAHLKLLAQVPVQPQPWGCSRYWPGSQDSSRAEWLLTWPTHSSDCAKGSCWFFFPHGPPRGLTMFSQQKAGSPRVSNPRPNTSRKDPALEVVLHLAS